eukprot:COSAG06_NODE_63589_length_262_cov_0.527607_1_plen_52_part_01
MLLWFGVFSVVSVVSPVFFHISWGGGGRGEKKGGGGGGGGGGAFCFVLFAPV